MKLGYTKKEDGKKLVNHFNQYHPELGAVLCQLKDGSWGALSECENTVFVRINKGFTKEGVFHHVSK